MYMKTIFTPTEGNVYLVTSTMCLLTKGGVGQDTWSGPFPLIAITD